MDPKPLKTRHLPTLEHTWRQLQESARLVTRAWYSGLMNETFFAVAKFLLEPQQRLLSSDPEQWQNHAMTQSYLAGRESLALHSNVSYLFENTDQPITFIERAAHLAVRALKFAGEIARGTLSPEVESGYSLEQAQYPYFFGTSRLPGTDQDSLFHVHGSRHFIVAIEGHFYRVELGEGEPSTSELAATLSQIVTEHKNTEPTIGRLSALPRPIWTKHRQSLMESRVNATTLRSIDSGLFVLALDLEPSGPTRRERRDAMRQLVLGNLHNRWFDKSHQLIVMADGSAGINRDHSFLDGHPTLRYVQHLCSDPMAPIVNKGQPLRFELLQWEISSETDQALKSATDKLAAEVASFTIDLWDHSDLSADIAKGAGLSADFLMQAAIHLASKQIFGTPVNITEAVHMRHTKGGRYDSILTLTREMHQVVTKFDSMTPSETVELLKAANEAHRARIKACKQGQSPVLHLIALLGADTKRGLFSVNGAGIYWGGRLKVLKAAWHDITSCAVTTSHPGYRPGLESSGFTDTYPGVLGISYLVKANQTTIYLKADHERQAQATIMRRELDRALTRIRAIL